VVFGKPSVCLSLCTYVWTDIPLLAPKHLDAFYSYSLFKSLYIIDRCPVTINILSPKIGTIEMGSQKPNGHSLDYG
jgi:hypothetical protein